MNFKKSISFLLTLIFLSHLTISKMVFPHGFVHKQIADVTKEIEKNPDDPNLYLKRGELYRYDGDVTAALKDFDRVVKLKPDLYLVDLAKGKLMYDAGSFSKAKNYLDKFLKKDPEYIDGLILRARILSRLHEYQKAVDDYSQVIEKSSEPKPEYFIERARARASIGDTLQALQGLDEGIKTLGQIVTLQLYAIDLEIQIQDYDSALQRVDEISKQSARKEKWLLRRGQILQKAKRHNEARATFLEALKQVESLSESKRHSKVTQILESKLKTLLANPMSFK